MLEGTADNALDEWDTTEGSVRRGKFNTKKNFISDRSIRNFAPY
jgi:hypothetical protein